MKLGRAPAERSRAPGGWVVAALAALAPACAVLPATPASTPDVPAVGASSAALHPVVEFEFESLDERPVSSMAARGKPTVLAFVTTGSLMAQAQVDFLVAMAKHDGEKLNYALVALEEPRNRELVQLYKTTLAVPFPVALADAPTLGGEGSFGDVTAVPVTVVLDRAGRVILRAAGRVVKSEELRAALRGL